VGKSEFAVISHMTQWDESPTKRSTAVSRFKP